MRFESQFLPVWLPGPQARYYMLNVRVECPAVFQQAAHGAVQAIGAHPTPAGTPLKSAGNGYKRNYEKLVAGQSAYRPIVTAERVSTVEGLFPAARVAATELRTDAPEG